MNRNQYKILFLLFLMLCLYLVVFRTKTATYQGENSNWHVEVKAKLKGLNGSHTIRIQYKGKQSIIVREYHIKPFFEGEYEPKLINGQINYQCKDDCGYFAKNETLIFYIAWSEKANEKEKINLIEVTKTK